MLSHSNNTLLNKTSPINITNSGSNYDFINPANQHFFSYTNPVQGQFDFLISSVLPGDGSYHLLVEQRNCPNVNKIPQNRALGGLNLRSGGNEDTRPAAFVMNRLTETPVMRVYPNPSTDQIILDVAAQEINIFDGQGRSILQTVNPMPQQTVQVSHWPAGTYFVSAVTTEGEVLVTQFQKQ